MTGEGVTIVHEYFLNRYDHGADSTLSFLCDDTGRVLGHFVEDEYREVKVRGETRIGEGYFEILLRKEGDMNARYAERYPDIHKGMLWLQDVPNFEWIYIHIGNDDDDSLGCLITGSRPNPNYKDGGGTVQSSVDCYRRIYPLIADQLERGERVFIKVRNYNGGKVSG